MLNYATYEITKYLRIERFTKNNKLNSSFHNGKWVPARPLGLSSLFYWFRCAWLVFIGQADALVWPEGQ